MEHEDRLPGRVVACRRLRLVRVETEEELLHARGRVDVDGPVGNGVALHKAVSFGLSDRPRNHSELVHETMQRRVCRQESEPA